MASRPSRWPSIAYPIRGAVGAGTGGRAAEENVVPSPSEARGKIHAAVRRSEGRMTDLTALSLAQARDALRTKEFTAIELADAHLKAIEAALRAQCLRQRKRPTAPAIWRSPPICGWRKARGGRSRAAARLSRIRSAPKACAPPPARTILENFVPNYESTVTANLWRDGAVLLGKLNNRRVRDGLVERDINSVRSSFAVAAQ